MIYEIGIHYTGDTVYDQQIKLNNIPINKNQKKFWFGSNIIPHWNEDDINTWVKVPILYNGLNKIYVDDSQIKDLSNIDETMIFGDDFRNETALDTSKWTVTNNVGATISFPGLLKVETLSASDVYTFNTVSSSINNTIWYIKYYFNYTNSHYIRLRIRINTSFDIIEPGDYKQLFFNGYIANKYMNNNTDYLIENKYSTSTAYLNIYSNNQLFYSSSSYTPTTNYLYISLGENSSYFDGGLTTYLYYVYNIKQLPSTPVITYIKPYQRMFHIKNTIFNQSNKILSYNPQYMETPVIELSSPQRLSVDEQIKNVFYYRGSNISPDITQSGNIVDDSNVIHNYWDQNTISNSGWNNTIPSDYITYTSNTIIDYKYVQYKIPIPNHR